MLYNRLMLIALLIVPVLISRCGDDCSNYSKYSCKEIEKATYNVYFYYPSGTEDYLGLAVGLPNCGVTAHNFAASKNLTKNNEWSYVCCMKAEGSDCLEKHR